jgi:neutral/alkaline ceramidase-like enzyme
MTSQVRETAMRDHLRPSLIILLLLLAAVASPAAQRETQPGTLRVGAARVDITPPADAALPMSGYDSRKEGFHAIHDPIYARAVVLSDGSTAAAILAWELIGMPNGVWQSLSERVSRELGIPVENIIFAGEHVHSAPSLAGMYGETSPKTFDFTKKVEGLAFDVVRRAQKNLQPARLGVGMGISDVNVNRRELLPEEGWWLGYNPDGPSDKVVTVLKFESLAGRPIALLINYGVHGVVMGSDNYQVSGDLPGATSRFVERYYLGKVSTRLDAGWDLKLRPEESVSGDGMVALWTSGPAGDQNPIALDSGEDFTMVDALGRILGEDVVRVANRMTRMSSEASIRGSQKVVTCPGQKVAAGPRPRKDYQFEAADPVNIRLSLLMVGNVALAGVSGEVLTPIYERLRAESPFNPTIMVTHANGSSGYIPNDAAYDQTSYEITTTHLKRGCAENAIVGGFLDIMDHH